jgi:hypothetical protein
MHPFGVSIDKFDDNPDMLASRHFKEENQNTTTAAVWHRHQPKMEIAQN